VEDPQLAAMDPGPPVEDPRPGAREETAVDSVHGMALAADVP